jgi:hypothetical protein
MERRGNRTSRTFLTNHARVLTTIARDPEVRLRDVATSRQLTERAVQAIVNDLETARDLTHTHEGRRNRYQITPETRLRHPADTDGTVQGLLQFLQVDAGSAGGAQ